MFHVLALTAISCLYLSYSYYINLPLFKKALQRTTTLTFPVSSTIGGGAMSAIGSEARIEGAEAEDACMEWYILGSRAMSVITNRVNEEDGETVGARPDT